MTLEFSHQIFKELSNIKFHENLSSGKPVAHANGHTDTQTYTQTDTQTDMTKLIVAFRNFSNAPKNIKTKNVVKQVNLS